MEPASQKSEPQGAGVSAVLAASAPSPTEIQRLDQHSPAGLKDVPLPRPEATLNTSPPRPTNGVFSSVLSSPDGDEFDHAFHPLSDVMYVFSGIDTRDLRFTSYWIIASREQSERSSLSTWQTRHGESAINHHAPTSQPYAQSGRSLRLSALTTSPWTRSSRREGPDGTTQAPAAVRERQRSALPSSRSPDSLHVTAADFDRDSDNSRVHRIDATARLIGRSKSSASSIFSDTARNAARRAESAFERSHAPDAAAAPVTSGRISPVRRVSPEVARRAARFGLVRPSSPPLTAVPPSSTTLLVSAEQVDDGDGPAGTSDALPSPPYASSPQSLSTDHEHLREARPADTSTHGLCPPQTISMAPDRPIKHEVSAL